VPNTTRLWKLLKIAEFRTPTPQDVRKKGSQILKLPPVRNCFILAITNKLVVIMNSLKVPKIKKILLYETKFLAPNYSCLQNPWLGGYRLQIPVLSVLCPQMNLLNPPPPKKFLGTPLGKGKSMWGEQRFSERRTRVCSRPSSYSHCTDCSFHEHGQKCNNVGNLRTELQSLRLRSLLCNRLRKSEQLL